MIFKHFMKVVVLCALANLPYFSTRSLTYADDTTKNLNTDSAQVEAVKSDKLTDLTDQEKKRLYEKQGEFAFANQLDGFSLNYLILITHYLGGASLPAICRNPALSYVIPLPLPTLNPDNVIFALGSIMYLYTEVLIYDHLQNKYKEIQDSYNKSDNKKENTIESLKAYEASLAYQIELIDIKENATRALKAAWLLSAVVSLGQYFTLGNIPDICIPFSTALGSVVGGALLADQFNNYAQSMNFPVKTSTSIPSLNRLMQFNSHSEIFKIIEQITKPSYYEDNNEIKGIFSLYEKDFAALRSFLKNEKFQIFAKTMLGQLTPEALASGPQSNSSADMVDEFRESSDNNQKIAETQNPLDFINVFSDIQSGFQGGINLVNLAESSSMASDMKELFEKQDFSKALEIQKKYFSAEFLVKFADYLGFRNGGEIAFLAYLAVSVDMVVLKARSYLIHPVAGPFIYDGTFLFKIVSSLIGAMAAQGYRTEILEAKEKIIQMKSKVKSQRLSVEEQLNAGSLQVQSQGNADSALTFSAPNGDNEGMCISSSEGIGPDSIGPCPPKPEEKSENAFVISDKTYENNLSPISSSIMPAQLSLGESMQHLSKGNMKNGQKSLQELGNHSVALAKAMRNGLKKLDTLKPEKKIKEEIKNHLTHYMNGLQSAFKAAKINPSKLNNNRNLGVTPSLANLMGQKNEEKGKEDKNLKEAGLAVTKSFLNKETDESSKGMTNFKNSQVGSFDEKEYAKALKQEYVLPENQKDVIDNKDESIFKIITLRYFKSAFPTFFKKKP